MKNKGKTLSFYFQSLFDLIIFPRIWSALHYLNDPLSLSHDLNLKHCVQVEGMSSLVLELAKMAAQEQALLDQSRDLLSMVAAMHVSHTARFIIFWKWFN